MKKDWQRSSAEIIDVFDQILPDLPAVEKRKMFGYPCSFVNGNMFMGIHQEDIFLRLSESDRREFLKLDQAHLFEPMPGRPMQEYVILPSWLLKDPARLEKWIEKSLAYVSSLPRKAKKK